MHAPSTLTAAITLLATAAAVHGQPVLYVDASSPAGGDGQSWSTAYRDLQSALDRVVAERWSFNIREVRVAQGVYRPASAARGFCIGSPSALVSGVTLDLLGSFGGRQAPDPDARDFVATRTILSGDVNADDGPGFTNRADNAGPVFGFYAEQPMGGLAFDGFEVQGGRAVFSPFNTLAGGGGINIITRFQRGVTISNCTVRDCESVGGGPGGILGGSGLIIRSSAVIANRGDGINTWGLELTDSLVADNLGTGVLGSNFGLSALISRTVIAGNTAAGDGGGVILRAGDVLEDSVVAANAAGGSGGGVRSAGGSVLSTTIAHNTAASGGGLSTSGTSETWVGNSILSGNTSTGPGAQIVKSGGTLTLARDLIQTGQAGIAIIDGASPPVIIGMLEGDPLFASPLGPDGSAATWNDNDYRLTRGSGAIDASFLPGPGHQRRATPALDLDGHARGDTLTEDLGCYELQPRCEPDLDQDGNADQQDIALLIAIIAGAPVPPGVEPDFNRDGTPDAQDVYDLIGTVAGAGCPSP